jgi:hypothetical protein
MLCERAQQKCSQAFCYMTTCFYVSQTPAPHPRFQTKVFATSHRQIVRTWNCFWSYYRTFPQEKQEKQVFSQVLQQKVSLFWFPLFEGRMTSFDRAGITHEGNFSAGWNTPEFILPPLFSRKPLPGQKQFRPEHDYLAPLTCPGNREAFHRSAISSPLLQLPATVSRKVRHHRAADHTPP